MHRQGRLLILLLTLTCPHFSKVASRESRRGSLHFPSSNTLIDFCISLHLDGAANKQRAASSSRQGDGGRAPSHSSQRLTFSTTSICHSCGICTWRCYFLHLSCRASPLGGVRTICTFLAPLYLLMIYYINPQQCLRVKANQGMLTCITRTVVCLAAHQDPCAGEAPEKPREGSQLTLLDL